MGTGVRLVDRAKLLYLFNGLPSTSTTLWINMALYNHVTFILNVLNATTVTGSAITLNQAQSVAGTGSKALVYNNYFASAALFGSQVATADVMTQVTGVSGTFTTNATNSTKSLYAIEVHDTDLDLNNNFKCVQMALATGVATTIGVIAVCGAPGRYTGNYAQNPSALV